MQDIANWLQDIGSWLIEALAAVIIGTGAGLAIVAFLARRIVDYNLERSADRFRAELAERTEALKVELGIRAHEYAVALSRVDAQRSEAINRIHAALRSWVKPTARIVAGCPIVNASTLDQLNYFRERAEEAHAAAMSLVDAVADNSLYLPGEIYEQVVDTVGRSTHASAAFLRVLRQAEAQQLEPTISLRDVAEARQRLAAIFHDELQPLHQDITAAFRKLLMTAEGDGDQRNLFVK